jgi:molybdopterin molybdotransferase
MTISFEKALSTVREKLNEAASSPGRETLSLDRVGGRVLAADITADRDYPPFHRSTRDGYAVRAGDLVKLPATLQCVGEVRAGEHFENKVGPGQSVMIMTGAPLPAGADAVVMLEYTSREGTRVEVSRAVESHENVVRQGSEAASGSRVLPCGRRLGPSEMGLLATVGQAHVEVFLKPRVAILPTGDEVVPFDRQPEWCQIRNSNAVTLTAQVAAAGGVPWRLDIAPDRVEPLRRLIEEGLRADLLLLSGGVSMGKYDLVERVLAELGAEFFFQGVAIRPGKPLVFGRVREKFFFGLPGNPVSTFVTFELFVRPAIALLGGADFECPVFLRARLGKPFHHRIGLTAFMPARVEDQRGEPVVNLVGYQGSGDLVGVAAANCFLVVHPEQTDLGAGDWVDVLPKPV